jgi:hypothetical protein
VSAEISTLIQPAELSLGTLTLYLDLQARTPVALVAESGNASLERPEAGASARHSSLEPVVDVVLQFLWVLVGVFVWVVLLIKGSERRDAHHELVPIVWPELDRPPLGLPALGLRTLTPDAQPVPQR